MDFHALLAKMKAIDSMPTAAPVDQITQECGDPMMPPSTMSQLPTSQTTPPPAHPSMSVNLNAQGMDNIEQMMKLFQKVNPDMMPKIPEPMPGISPMPGIASIKPEIPPLKMLPVELDQPKADPMADMGNEPEMNIANTDNDNDSGELDSLGDIDPEMGKDPGNGDDGVDRAHGDLDNDGDHDMDDHDMEKDAAKKDEDGGFQNATTEPEERYKSVDYMNNKLAGGMNKPKSTFPKVSDGDNPMQKVKESEDAFRASIRADLQRRLNEAKGVK
jgi:hypothetical protein